MLAGCASKGRADAYEVQKTASPDEGFPVMMPLDEQSGAITRIVNRHPQSRIDDLLPRAYPSAANLKAVAREHRLPFNGGDCTAGAAIPRTVRGRESAPTCGAAETGAHRAPRWLV